MLPEDEVKQTIQVFASGGATRNTDQIASVLSPKFQVLINRFNGTVGTATLAHDVYLQMIRDGKLGGATYTLTFSQVTVYKHMAEAEVWYRGEKADIHHFFLLVHNEQNKWLLISDMAINEPK